MSRSLRKIRGRVTSVFRIAHRFHRIHRSTGPPTGPFLYFSPASVRLTDVLKCLCAPRLRRGRNDEGKSQIRRRALRNAGNRRVAPRWSASRSCTAIASRSAISSTSFPSFPSSASSHNLASHRVAESPITNHHSRITAFLIDTLAIRIALKSLACMADEHSNRHSLGASKVHQNCATPPSFTARKALCAAQFSMYSGRP